MTKPFKPTVIEDTRLDFWQERDRCHVCLTRIKTDSTMIEWWDEAVGEAVEDGFLDWDEAVLGNMKRFVKQFGALHESAFERWKEKNEYRRAKRIANDKQGRIGIALGKFGYQIQKEKR